MEHIRLNSTRKVVLIGKILLPLLITAALILSIFGILNAQAARQGLLIIYVDKSAEGGNNGTSWEDAFVDLHSALEDGTPGTEIWVATGVYTPGANVGDSFVLGSGVSLYGGFAATETIRTERDWEVNLTILSGDIGGDDLKDANGIVTDAANIIIPNNQTILTAFILDSGIVLDGFIITGGDNIGNGGGMNITFADATLANLVFSGNNASNGGGLYNGGNKSLTMTNTIFRGNTARNGGGMVNDTSDTTLTDVFFYDNIASNEGGGMDNMYNNVDMTNVTFSGNSALNGGGLNTEGSSITLINGSFLGNSTTASGGGMRNYANNNSTLINVLFSGNLAGTIGGGMYSNGGIVTATNITISGNRANTQYVDAGGGLYNSNSDLIFSNSIFWNNREKAETGSLVANITNDISTTITVTNSILQGSGGSGAWITNGSYVDGGNNKDVDPLFIQDADPANAPTTEGDLRLSGTSPARDAGNDIYLPAAVDTDLDGNTRIIGPSVDMGAFEFQSSLLNIYLPLVIRE